MENWQSSNVSNEFKSFRKHGFDKPRVFIIRHTCHSNFIVNRKTTLCSIIASHKKAF